MHVDPLYVLSAIVAAFGLSPLCRQGYPGYRGSKTPEIDQQVLISRILVHDIEIDEQSITSDYLPTTLFFPGLPVVVHVPPAGSPYIKQEGHLRKPASLQLGLIARATASGYHRFPQR